MCNVTLPSRRRNHCCDGKGTIHSFCIVEPHVSDNNIEYWVLQNNAFKVVGDIETYLNLRVKCPILLSDFNQIWSFLTNPLKSPQYQISLQSVPWQSRWHTRADGHDEANRRFLRPRERA